MKLTKFSSTGSKKYKKIFVLCLLQNNNEDKNIHEV